MVEIGYPLKSKKSVDLAVVTKTLTGTEAMAATVNVRAFYDPGGADRQVNLPVEAAGVVEIVNTADAAETLTVKDDSGTDTIGIVSRYCAARFVCDGTTWRMLQLRYIGGDLEISGALTVGGAVSAASAVIGGKEISSQSGESTFAGQTGQTISITPVASANYHVEITPLAESGFIGEVWISTRTTNAFVVKNSGSDVSTAFAWQISGAALA